MISETQKKIRKWFRRHGWKTAQTPTDNGFILTSPVENCAGYAYSLVDKNTGKEKVFCWEKMLDIELDRFNCDFVNFSIYKRRHIWKKDPTAKTDGSEYTWIPSDEFEEWTIKPESIDIPVQDILKLAELIKAAQEDWLSERPTKRHLNIMEHIAKTCKIRWIGVNSNYLEIKNAFSNDRLRYERNKDN